MATIEIRCQTVDKYRNTKYSNTKIQKIQKYTGHHCHPHCDNGESILGECRKGKLNNQQSLPTTGWPPTATPCDNILETEEEKLIYKN